MQRNGRVDEFLAEFAETLERAFLVMSGQPGIAHYVGGQDGSELLGRFHGPYVRPGSACQPEHVSEMGLAESTSGHTRSFGDVGPMSGFPERGHAWAIYEYTPFCNGPGGVKSPRVIVTPPSSRFCPWSARRPPHYAVRRNGEPI